MCKVVAKHRVVDHGLKEKMLYLRFAEGIKEIEEMRILVTVTGMSMYMYG